MADTKTQTPPVVDGADKKVKPEKPNEEEYQAALKKAEKDHADSMARFNAIRAKLDIAKPTSKDSPSAKKRADLISQLKEIKDKQQSGKSGRKELFDKIAKLDASIKTDIANQKTARGKVNFKSVDDLDAQIKRLEDQVNRGDMKIVDEKKALAEVSNLRKQRKGFSGFDDAEKSIATKKAEVKKLRDTLDDPESRALSDKYNTLQSELNTIKAEQDDAYKSINTLRDERTKLQNEQQEKYLAIKTLKDNYYQTNKAVQKWEFESRQRQRERRKQEQEDYVKGKKKERAQQMLSEASDKAYLDEIRRAEAVLRFLDPSYASEKQPLQAASKFAITSQRTVDDAGIKGTKVASKKDKEEDFFAAKPKTGKKGKKSNATTDAPTATSGKYSVPPSVLEDCNTLGVEPPLSAGDVEGVIEKVKAKLEHWKSDQAAQTERNIAKAKKEVERLDAEDSEANTPVPGTPHANGDGKATAGVDDGGNVKNEIELTKEGEDDAIADLKAASLEDKE